MVKGCKQDMGEVFAPFGDDDWGECVESDFVRLGAHQVVRELKQAEIILEGFAHASNEVSTSLYICISSAMDLARQARERAERYAGGQGRRPRLPCSV